MTKRKSLKNHIILHIIAAAILPALIIGGVAIYFSLDYAKTEQFNKNSYMIDNIKRRIDDFLLGSLRKLESTGNIAFLGHHFDEHHIEHLMEHLVVNNKHFIKIELADKSGIVKKIYPVDIDFMGIDVSNRRYFKGVKESEKPFWSPAFVSPQLERPVVSISIPLKEYVFTGHLSLEEISNIVKEAKEHKNTILTISDQNATYIAHTDFDKVMKREINSHYNFLKSKYKGRNFSTDFTINSKEMICHTGFVPYTSWAVSFYQEKDDLYAPALKVVKAITTIAVVILIFASFIFLGIFQNISKSLGHFIAYTKDIAQGNYSSIIGEEEKYEELYELARNFNKMTYEIQTREQEIKEGELYSNTLFREANIGLSLCTMEGKIIDANPAYGEIIGRTKQELMQLTYHDITPESYREISLRQLEELNNTGRFSFEKEYIHKDGRHVPVRVSSVLIEYKNTPFILSSVEDITEQKSMRDQLAHSEKMQAIGQLAGGIAHDFNNQLSGIMGFTDILLRKTDDEKVISHLENVMKCAERSATLTAQLLAFSRKGKYLAVHVNISEIADEVISLLQHSIDKKITILKNFNTDNSSVLGDPNQLQNAILNLAINSRDAMPGGGTLILKAESIALDQEFCNNHINNINPGNFLKLCISDTGTGIDEETMEHIFEPFYTTKEEGKGTGMGLASVYGTILSHNGFIEVNSTVGKGTDFDIYLPLTDYKEDYDKPIQIDAISPGTGNILVVDDEEIVRELASDMLEHIGYNVHSCSCGTEALEHFKENWQDIDLVILDLVMPDLSGEEVFAEIRSINPNIKVILSSGYTADEISQSITAEGLTEFISKPFKVSDLSEKVNRILLKM
jgi:PAS domain S-box-containing protein